MRTSHVHSRVRIVLAMAGVAALPVAVGAAQYFRVAGPTNSVITAFGGDGTLVWSNAVANATCTVQRAYTLGAVTDWQDYVQVLCPHQSTSNCLFDLSAPAGMAFVPAGIFQMGDNLGDGPPDERPVHTVYVSQFYMDTAGVTWANWQAVRDWSITNGYDLAGIGFGKATNHPVCGVNWYDCVKWCNARSQQAGLTPCYTHGGSVYTNGQYDDIVCNWSVNGYRLPTEAEREKAARSGLSGRRFPWGDTIDHTTANYWAYYENGANFFAYDSGYEGYDTRYAAADYPYTSPAGSFLANGYGFFDMSGNLREWGWDWYDDYPSGMVSNPCGPSASSGYGVLRVVRGGDWYDHAWFARAACRYNYGPNSRVNDVGFRAVRKPNGVSR